MLKQTLALIGLTLCLGANAATVTSFENGEVFDGRNGARDGVGDAMFLDISSYFNLPDGGGLSSQAMSYFDFSLVNTPSVNTATFSWDVNFSQNGGSPESTSVYFFSDDSSGLSLDDFNRGTLISTINTTGYVAGSSITVDLTTAIQTMTGNFFGISLASNDPDSSEHFFNMVNNNAQVEFTTSAVPLPAAAWLFGSGLLGLAAMKRKRS